MAVVVVGSGSDILVLPTTTTAATTTATTTTTTTTTNDEDVSFMMVMRAESYSCFVPGVVVVVPLGVMLAVLLPGCGWGERGAAGALAEEEQEAADKKAAGVEKEEVDGEVETGVAGDEEKARKEAEEKARKEAEGRRRRRPRTR